MAINSKVDICNLALSHLGNYGTIANIDTPTTSKELTFSLWYDLTRQNLLKDTMPNFALRRTRVARIVESDQQMAQRFGYAYVYEYPVDCLKVLGVGDVDDKRNNYGIEEGGIYTDDLNDKGLPIRYIGDITDLNRMSPEFKMGLSWALAENVAQPITQDTEKQITIVKLLPDKLSSLSALNAQENKPIRISRSLFKQARYGFFPSNQSKK